MRLGALVLATDPWPESAQLWRHLEELGVHTAYAADHLTHPTMAGHWFTDPWVLLAAAAGVTSRLRLGTLVASAAIRSPAPLARAAASLQEVSGGRFVLGLGMGVAPDVLADRGASETLGEMAARYGDVVRGLRALWAGEPSYAGRRVSVTGVAFAPHAPGREAPPLVLAGHGPVAMRLVADCADGWTVYGGAGVAGMDREEFWRTVAAQSRALDEVLEQRGRDRASLSRSVLVGFAGYRPLESPGSFREEVARAAALGFDELCFYWPFGEPGSRLWADQAVVEEAVRETLEA